MFCITYCLCNHQFFNSDATGDDGGVKKTTQVTTTTAVAQSNIRKPQLTKSMGNKFCAVCRLLSWNLQVEEQFLRSLFTIVNLYFVNDIIDGITVFCSIDCEFSRLKMACIRIRWLLMPGSSYQTSATAVSACRTSVAIAPLATCRSKNRMKIGSSDWWNCFHSSTVISTQTVILPNQQLYHVIAIVFPTSTGASQNSDS
jgi:hypothetical protein